MSALHLFEEHAEVLAHWWALRRTQATSGPFDVLYLDAHLDLQYVSPARVQSLRACTTQAEVAALAKRHPLMPDAGTAYGIEDFLYPASQLGLIARVTWIAPPHVDVDQPHKATAWLQQMQGVTPSDLASFQRCEQGWLEGCLLGLPLRIGRMHQLAHMDWPRPCVWDIDVDYCIALPGDRVHVTPADIAQTLRALPHAPLSISISRSVSTGFTPVQHGLLGDWFHAELMGDAAASEAWAQRLNQPLQHCQPQPESGEQPEAALLRQLTEIRARRLPCELGRVLMLARRVQQMAAPGDTQALAWAALGLLWVAMRQLERAMDCAQQHQALTGHMHAGLGVDIGRQLMQAGRFAQAQPWLSSGLEEDETRVAAHVYLAQTYAELGQQQEALTLLDQAIAMSPAWAELPRQRARWAQRA